MEPRPGAWRLAGLALVLLWIGIVTMHPHHNVLTGVSDPFPVHADEYVHWGFAQQIWTEGSVRASDPFSPSAASPESRLAAVHERGFQSYLAALHGVTGIGWLPIFQFLPSVVAMFTGLALFLVGERWKAGLATAWWFGAVPTSLRFLGPAFVVPIAFALPFVAMGIYLLLEKDAPGRHVALLLVLSVLWTIHTTGALVLTLLVILYGIAISRRAPMATALLSGIALVPLLFAREAVERMWAQIAYRPLLPLGVESLRLAGPVLYIAAAAGVFLLSTRSARRARAIGIALGIVLSALLAIIVYRATTGIDPFRAYDRSTLMVAFLACIPAGILTEWGARACLRWGDARRWRPLAALAVGAIVLLQGASVVQAQRATLAQDYYVSMTPAQYDAFTLASQRLGPEHTLALVDGGPTMPFTIVTGIRTLFVRGPETQADPEFVTTFFRNGGRDTRFLVETGTTVVVSDAPIRNPDLREVAPGVYALREDYVERMKGR